MGSSYADRQFAINKYENKVMDLSSKATEELFPAASEASLVVCYGGSCLKLDVYMGQDLGRSADYGSIAVWASPQFCSGLLHSNWFIILAFHLCRLLEDLVFGNRCVGYGGLGLER